jgi:hypothetical protein
LGPFDDVQSKKRGSTPQRAWTSPFALPVVVVATDSERTQQHRGAHPKPWRAGSQQQTNRSMRTDRFRATYTHKCDQLRLPLPLALAPPAAKIAWPLWLCAAWRVRSPTPRPTHKRRRRAFVPVLLPSMPHTTTTTHKGRPRHRQAATTPIAAKARAAAF